MLHAAVGLGKFCRCCGAAEGRSVVKNDQTDSLIIALNRSGATGIGTTGIGAISDYIGAIQHYCALAMAREEIVSTTRPLSAIITENSVM